MSDEVRYIVTGCGRSGTGFLAESLRNSGVPCTHEKFFSSKGRVQQIEDIGSGECEASWYAAPYLQNVAGLKVVHVVRDPVKVANSFYRLGLFSLWGWRNLIMNPSISFLVKKLISNPKFFSARASHAWRHQIYLRQNASDALKKRGEVARCLWYWHDWNILVETNCNRHNIPCIRIRLEDLIGGDGGSYEKLGLFIGADFSNGIDTEKQNIKLKYPERRYSVGCGDLPKAVASLAKRYGYDCYDS